VLDSMGKFSLHDETISSLMKWKPAPRYWKTVQNENFPEMAKLIDKTFLEDCEWFSRMWVVQEMVAATTANVLYHGQTVTLENFLRCICYMHYHLNAPVPHIRKLIGMEKIRMGWNEGKRQSLRDLIHETRYRRATDPRDKIFSLLGLMGDKMNNLLKPDYKKSVSAVYADVMYHWITQGESLDALCGWQTLRKLDELPSWVPDYSLTQDLAPSPLITQEGCEYNASGHDYRAKYDGKRDDWGRLPTRGLCIDSISLVSDSMPEDEPFGNIEKIWHSTVLAAKPLQEGLTDDVVSCLQKISNIVGQSYNAYANSTYTASTDNFSKYTNSTETLAPATTSITLVDEKMVSEVDILWKNTYILHAYLQTLLLGRISSCQRLTQSQITSILDLDFAIPSPFVDQVCKAFSSAIRKRNLGVTSKGYIGAMPQEAKFGDVVCVLFG